MPTCSIYGSANRLLRRFSTEAPGLGDSISVGTSPRCRIALTGMGAQDGVAEIHFSLVRKNDGWHLLTPGPALRLKNGHDAQNVLVAAGQEVAFGNCRIAFAADPAPSEFQFIWEPVGAPLAAMPLHHGANFIGSAEECDIHLDHPSVQHQHCAVRVDDWQLAVEPLGGSVVILNGHPVTDAVAIQVGDLLQLGEIRACVTGKNAPRRIPAPISGYALATWRVVNLVLLALLVGIVVYFLQQQGLLGGARPEEDAAPGRPGVKDTTELVQAAWADVASGNAEAALARLRNSQLPDRDPLLKAIAVERDQANRLIRYREQLAWRMDHFNNTAAISDLLNNQHAGAQLLPQVEYWNAAAAALTDGESAIRAADGDLPAHSWFIEQLPATLAEVRKMQAITVDCRRLNEAWFERRWDAVVVIFNQLFHVDEGSDETVRAFYQTALRRAQFGRALDVLWQDVVGCEFRTADFAAAAARLGQLEQDLPSMAFAPAEIGVVRDQLDGLGRLIQSLGAIQQAYRDWVGDHGLAHLITLGDVLRQARREVGTLPVVMAADLAIQGEIGDWLDTPESLSPEVSAENLLRCRTLMDLCLTTRFAKQGEVYRRLEEHERKLKLAIQQECDRLFAEYQAECDTQPAPVLLAKLDQVLRLAPPDHRYHVWAVREQVRIKAAK